jgi:hypothetical protein
MSVFDVEDGVFNAAIDQAGQASIGRAALAARGGARGSHVRRRSDRSASSRHPVGR